MSEKREFEGKTRVLVVDDHPLLRDALVQLLSRQSDLVVCGEADSVRSASAAVAKEKPNLILLDLRLGCGDSLEFIKSLMSPRTSGSAPDAHGSDFLRRRGADS